MDPNRGYEAAALSPYLLVKPLLQCYKKKFKNFLNLGECIIFSKVTYWKLFHYPNILLISRSQYPTKKVWVMLSLRETNPYNFLYIFQISHKLWNTKWSDPPVYDDATRRHHR